MSNEALLALFGVLGGGLAAIRWLMEVNHKQTVQLQTQKREQTQRAIDELKSITDDLKKEIKLLRQEVQEAATGFKNNSAGFKSLNETLKNYIESNEKRIGNITTEIINLGKQFKLVRNSQNGKRDK